MLLLSHIVFIDGVISSSLCAFTKENEHTRNLFFDIAKKIPIRDRNFVSNYLIESCNLHDGEFLKYSFPLVNADFTNPMFMVVRFINGQFDYIYEVATKDHPNTPYQSFQNCDLEFCNLFKREKYTVPKMVRKENSCILSDKQMLDSIFLKKVPLVNSEMIIPVSDKRMAVLFNLHQIWERHKTSDDKWLETLSLACGNLGIENNLHNRCQLEDLATSRFHLLQEFII